MLFTANTKAIFILGQTGILPVNQNDTIFIVNLQPTLRWIQRRNLVTAIAVRAMGLSCLFFKVWLNLFRLLGVVKVGR